MLGIPPIFSSPSPAPPLMTLVWFEAPNTSSSLLSSPPPTPRSSAAVEPSDQRTILPAALGADVVSDRSDTRQRRWKGLS